MAKADSIPPFPADIDRDAFGHWLSGFADGEGCFFLTTTKVTWKSHTYRSPVAAFILTIRADDSSILDQVKAFLACGYTTPSRARPNTRGAKQFRNPICDYRVNGARDLFNKVVPNFLRYPLRAKKARDFIIWKEAVALMAQIVAQPWRSLGHLKGWRTRWNQDSLARFMVLHDALRSQRQYQAPTITSITHKETPGLFTDLP